MLDARTGAYTAVRPARTGLLRVGAVVPPGTADLTALRVLLTADLLSRTAELSGLQGLTVWVGASGVEAEADELGIHPPAASLADALDGPVDVLVTASGLGAAASAIPVRVGDAEADGYSDLLAVRLALMASPYHQPVSFTSDSLASTRETVARWRRLVARWAETPSRPIPPSAATALREAFADLDTPAVVALLSELADDEDVPAGARFETFAFADRVLGLDLTGDIGRI